MESESQCIRIDGSGEHTIVMLHGWPDTGELWHAQVADLQADYRCVRLTLPGFAADEPSRALNMDEVVAWLDESIRRVSDRPVILMAHDWGAVFAYAYVRAYPERVARLIGLDIGDTSQAFVDTLSTKHQLMMMGYQLPLALSYRLPRWLANPMTRSIAKMLRAPVPAQSIHAGMNFPYYQAWFGGKKRYQSHDEFIPHCPMLFVYGTRKPFQFFAPSWAQKIADLPNSQVVAMRAGHWMMVDAPDEFNRIVRGWLAQTDEVS